ncbi:hypothetical protein [Streptomyces sp. NPDC001843]|uniref:hypothetical protein n=1 Tax=Streptomyces sp. NPDC001843 TaxID=3364617 RepID=UPI003680CECB
MPRVAPDGLLRPGLPLMPARYVGTGRAAADAPHLVARTPPAWTDAGQRIGLALWDARRSDELRVRSGADRPPHTDGGSAAA